MSWFDHLFILFFTVVLPYHGWRSYPRFVEIVKHDPKSARRGIYISNMIALWVLTSMVLLVWNFTERPVALLGLMPLTGMEALVSLSIVIALIAVAIIYYRTLMQLDRKYQWTFVPELLPRTRQELKLFLYLSVTAGFAEEILYRGYLMWYLLHFGNILFAVLFSSVLFAVAHAYQGRNATLVIFPVGLLFALLYVYSGSLLAPILLHIAINSYAGIYGRKMFGNG